MRRWTKGEDELAAELAADGYTRADVAAEMGRSFGSVESRLRRLRVPAVHPRKPPDAELRAACLALVGAGLTAAAAAVRLGRAKWTVCELLHRLERDGLVSRTGYGRWTRWRVTKLWTDDDDAQRAEARALAREGLSASEIARRLGRSKDGVIKWLGGE